MVRASLYTLVGRVWGYRMVKLDLPLVAGMHVPCGADAGGIAVESP